MKSTLLFSTACFASCLNLAAQDQPTLTYRALMTDIIIEADLWTTEPELLSANYAFEGIEGVNFDEDDVRAAGGAWNTTDCNNPPNGAVTSAQSPNGVAVAWGFPTYFADAMPVVFSWPVLPSTVQPSDFQILLNTGEIVYPEVASIMPNFEYNERHVVVVFGEYGNRLPPSDPEAIYIDTVTIVDDGSPLMLIGPNGQLTSAVGLSYESSHPYVEGNGPVLVAAKLNYMSTAGEGGGPAAFGGNFPNDGLAYYGDQAQYRLRIYTSGGFSPDGVTSVQPTDFETFFRLHLENDNAETVILEETGIDYMIDGSRIRIVGLADLGLLQDTYNNCYIEDHDNYIDIILNGDEAAMRKITAVEIPADDPVADPDDRYRPFYNPGGPGNNPTPGVTYTAAGPYDLQPVVIALDDPMTTTYFIESADSDGDGLTDGQEILVYKTNPSNPDTDGDTLTDGEEVQTTLSPLVDDSSTINFFAQRTAGLALESPVLQRRQDGGFDLILALKNSEDLVEFNDLQLQETEVSVENGAMKIALPVTPWDSVFYRVFASEFDTGE